MMRVILLRQLLLVQINQCLFSFPNSTIIRLYAITLVFILFSISTILGQVDLKNGLVACYPFNANTTDETGNGNNGTVNGATLTTDRFGKANSAYNFKGSSLISVNPAQFKNQSYTYATWVKLDNLPTGGDNNCFNTIGGSGGDQVLSVTSSYQS